jgi:hypothetical protein
MVVTAYGSASAELRGEDSKVKFPLYFFGILVLLAGHPIVGLVLIWAGWMAAE